MNIRFYNSLSGKIEDFKPVKENEVSIYVCGPTVYNDPHIGNMRPVVFFDTFRKFLEEIGYTVNMFQIILMSMTKLSKEQSKKIKVRKN